MIRNQGADSVRVRVRVRVGVRVKETLRQYPLRL